jgi:arylsulfatase A-like enzyme
MLLGLTTALAQQKPNMLVIFGDNVGIMNLSAYHRGMMGGSTPNLDRIAGGKTD